MNVYQKLCAIEALSKEFRQINTGLMFCKTPEKDVLLQMRIRDSVHSHEFSDQVTATFTVTAEDLKELMLKRAEAIKFELRELGVLDEVFE